jgi:hypothetical protein
MRSSDSSVTRHPPEVMDQKKLAEVKGGRKLNDGEARV